MSKKKQPKYFTTLNEADGKYYVCDAQGRVHSMNGNDDEASALDAADKMNDAEGFPRVERPQPEPEASPDGDGEAE